MFVATRVAFRTPALAARALTTKATTKKAATTASKQASAAVTQAQKRFQHTDRPVIDADTVLILEHLIASSSRMTAELNLILMKLKGRAIDLDTLGAIGSSSGVKGKKPDTSYHVFYKHYFKVYSEENPDLTAQEVTKIVSDMWGKFSKDEKKNWTLPPQ